MAFTQVDQVTLTVANVTEEGEPEPTPTPPPDGAFDIGSIMSLMVTMMIVVMMMGVMMETMEGGV